VLGALAVGCGGRKTLAGEVEKTTSAQGAEAALAEEESGALPEEAQSEEERATLRQIREFTGDLGADYKIGFGDLLEILFYGDPSLNHEVTVRPDGKISFPRVGDIPAAGLTPAELSSAITELYAEFLKNPEATVLVKVAGSQFVYVLGQVVTPNSIPIHGRISVTQAISEAGGWTTTAQLTSVMVVRRGQWEKPRALRVDLTRAISGEQLIYDVPLQAFDIVYVPQTFIGDAGDFADNLFTKFIVPPLNAFVRGYDAFYPRQVTSRTR